MEATNRALFLDRDGVVNREIGYLWKPEQTEFMPGIFELCCAAQKQGYKLIIITNQAGIARQLYSESDFHDFMHWMALEFDRRKIQLTGYYFCPHHPEYGAPEYRLDCPDRKPRPGMLFRAAHDHHIDLNESLLIGDRCTDIEAGAAAGIQNLLLMSGTEVGSCSHPVDHIEISCLADAIPLLTRNRH